MVSTATEVLPRRRRTQAERSATTRAKVIDAAAHCVSENGFNHTTTADIGRRAGVTWGAIQHQFGDKDAIFFAVIEKMLDELAEIVREEIKVTDTLQQRCAAFVQSMWQVYQTPVFRAGLEILLGTRSRAGSAYGKRTRELIMVLTDLFRESFASFGISQAKQVEAQRFALATLAGFALEQTFNGPGGDFDSELETLTGTLAIILAGNSR